VNERSGFDLKALSVNREINPDSDEEEDEKDDE